MPTELWVELAKQIPVPVLCVVIVWLTWRYLPRTQDRHIQSLNKQHKALVDYLANGFKDHLQSKEAEILRLVKDKEALQERIKWLEDRLSGREEKHG